ncbi:MAG: vWA domain-containing protein [Planctomycetota bacterium]|jgi:hypothetical protein
MTFANLWAFWFAAVALPVVALYFFRIRRKRQDVPHLALWRKVLEERRTTFLLKRLRRLLSLLLQLLILVFLVLALGRPVISAFFARDPHLVLVLDCSASMRAVEGAGGGAATRFARAVDAAEEYVRSKPDATEVMVLAADRDLSILCPFTSDARLLAERVRAARPTLYPADLARACRLAAEVLRDRGGGRVVLLSDGTGPPADELRRVVEGAAGDAAGEVSLTASCVGETDDNVGIVNFAARKNDIQKTDEVLVAVRNFSSQPKEVSLEYSEGETLRKVFPLTLEPGEEAKRTFSTSLPDGEVLRARLPPGDAFAADDVAFAVVRPEKRFRILLVAAEEDRFFYVKAFNAMEEAVHEDSLVVSPEQYASHPAARAGGFDLSLFVRCRVPDDLPEGTHVIVDCDAPGVARTVGRAEAERVSEWDRTHPVNRYVTYHDLVVREARLIETDGDGAADAAQVIARSERTPLVLVRETAAGRIVYVGFDVRKTELPFRVAFPAVLRNVLAWSHRRRAEPFRARYATGATIEPLAPLPGEGDGAATVTFLVDGEQASHVVPLDERRGFAFTETDTVAPCRIDVGGRSFFTAVSLLAPEESAIGPGAAAGGEDASGSATRPTGWLQSLFSSARFWKVLIALASLLLAAEWLLFHRRVTE